MMKRDIRRLLMERQMGHCIVNGCPYDARLMGSLDLHRIVPGREGGEYELPNCVLVCRVHHMTIEGLDFQGIGELRCTWRTLRKIWEDMTRKVQVRIEVMQNEEISQMEQGFEDFVRSTADHWR